jgi:hypothetical protein
MLPLSPLLQPSHPSTLQDPELSSLASSMLCVICVEAEHTGASEHGGPCLVAYTRRSSPTRKSPYHINLADPTSTTSSSLSEACEQLDPQARGRPGSLAGRRPCYVGSPASSLIFVDWHHRIYQR